MPRRLAPGLGVWILTLTLLAPLCFVEWQLAWFLGPAIYAGYTAAALALLIVVVVGGRHWQSRAACGVLLAGVAVLYAYPWTSRKAFLQQFSRVEPGMSIPQVEAILSEYRPIERQPSDGVTILGYRHDPSSPRFDADGALVRFENGLVVLKQFLPD